MIFVVYRLHLVRTVDKPTTRDWMAASSMVPLWAATGAVLRFLAYVLLGYLIGLLGHSVL